MNVFTSIVHAIRSSRPELAEPAAGGIVGLSAPAAHVALGMSGGLTTSQANAPKPQPAVEGDKLNLGCGFDLRPGWINIDLHDRHNPDMVCDVTDLAPLDDNIASYVLAQDILEHIHRDKCQSTLREWNRVMKMGALIEIRVPDVLKIAHLMAADARFADLQGHRAMLHCLFGTQAYLGDFHFNGFTELSLKDDLESSGFKILYLAHQDEWLFDVVAEKVRHTPPDPLYKIEDPNKFIAEAYRRLLGREVDAGGQAYCMDLLTSGSPKEVVVTMIRSSEEGVRYSAISQLP